MMGEGTVNPLPDVLELEKLPPLLTHQGASKLFGKARNTVLMHILKGHIRAFKDGSVTLVYAYDCAKLWGNPFIKKGGEQ